MVFTGLDGEKRFSVRYSPLRKRWEPVERGGRVIEVIPSHLSHVKIQKAPTRNIHDLRKALGIEVSEKFGEVFWDVKLSGDNYCLALFKDFLPKKGYHALDPEVFSLARVCRAIGVRDAFVLDVGKRKTTLVEVSEGSFRSYRVILKGGDYLLKEIIEKKGVGEGEALALLRERGVEDSVVGEVVESVLSSLGREIGDAPVLLSGGFSRIKGFKTLFGDTLENPFAPPEMSSAFGASLKFIYRDSSPDFREEEVSDSDLKKAALLMGGSLLALFLTTVGLTEIRKETTKAFRERERKEFRERFPTLPAIAVRDQVKGMAFVERSPITRRLVRLSENLGDGIKIYRIEFSDGVLKVMGEAKGEELLKGFDTKSVRKTPEGGLEFEVEIR
ncbi:MAG TPA: hypothetical protein EYH49_04855 [Aquifex aeolicus]|nr:hypothetical protein [Aquifex aeolicus]